MAETLIHQAQIESLGRKLDTLSEQLSEEEKTLLMVVFGLAKKAFDAEAEKSELAEVSGFGMGGLAVDRPSSMPSVSSAFGGAFASGGSSGMASAAKVHGEGGISGGSGGITGTIKIVF